MDQVQSRQLSSSRTRSIVYVALTVALMAVSAWVTIPIGPVPITLQMFAITFAIVVLSPKESVAAIAAYLALGAVGLPVFSSMRGGIGVLAGPTGGFLWGYLFGVALAALLLWVTRGHRSAADARKQAQQAKAGAVAWFRAFAWELVAGCVFTAVSYLCGWAQYMAVAGVEPLAAFSVCIAPFVVIDLCKIVAAVACANAVLRVRSL